MLAPLSASGWAGSPPPDRRWLVPGLIPMGVITLLSGDGGVGKSALMKQLGLAASLGSGWLGRRVFGGRVLGVFAEDDEDEIGRRVIRIAAGEGLDLAAAKDLLVIGADTDALKAGAALATSTDGKVTATPLFAELAELVAEIKPVLIVLDPAAEIAAIDENRRSEVAAFGRLLRGLAASSGAAIVLIAHPSLTGMASGSGLSGSTAWNNSVRSRLYLTAPDQNDPEARRLALVKTNYAKPGTYIDLRLANGRFVAAEAASEADRSASSEAAKTAFLALLRRFTAEGRAVADTTGTNYAPALFASEPEADGMSKADMKGAMAALFRDGRITVKHEGPQSRRRKRLAETGADEGSSTATATGLPPATTAYSEGPSTGVFHRPATGFPPATTGDATTPLYIPPVGGSTDPAVEPLGPDATTAHSSGPVEDDPDGWQVESAEQEEQATSQEEPPFDDGDDWSAAWSGSDEEPAGWQQAAE